MRVRVKSIFTGQIWEGDVQVPSEHPEPLEYLFRFFNRLDDDDQARLAEIGFTQTSISVGDTVWLEGERYTVTPMGFRQGPEAESPVSEYLAPIRPESERD